jgi:hypothetical protein
VHVYYKSIQRKYEHILHVQALEMCAAVPTVPACKGLKCKRYMFPGADVMGQVTAWQDIVHIVLTIIQRVCDGCICNKTSIYI